MNPLYKFLIGAGVILCLYYYAFSAGYNAAKAKAEAEQARAMAEAGQRIRDLQAESADTIADYVAAIDRINAAHLEELEALKNAQLSDVIEIPVNNSIVDKCPSVHNVKPSANMPAAEAKQNLLCYTDADLRTKIKNSLDIARECDALAVKYNALLADCTAATEK